MHVFIKNDFLILYYTKNKSDLHVNPDTQFSVHEYTHIHHIHVNTITHTTYSTCTHVTYMYTHNICYLTDSCLLGNIMFPWYAWTISKASQRVPDPLRNTSSGSIGIIVHSANMNG